MHADRLANTYLCFGGVGLACCFLMHHWGAGDPGTPITIEYARGNPLALLFFASALISASVIARLYHLGSAKAESLMYGCVAACIGLMMITSQESAAHSGALFAAVCLAALAPVIYVLRSEFSFWSILFLAAPLSATFVVAVASLLPNGMMGLGIAERVWYGVSYLVNAVMINMLYADGRLAENCRHSTSAQ